MTKYGKIGTAASGWVSTLFVFEEEQIGKASYTGGCFGFIQ
jgi:hypothetical protein